MDRYLCGIIGAWLGCVVGMMVNAAINLTFHFGADLLIIAGIFAIPGIIGILIVESGKQLQTKHYALTGGIAGGVCIFALILYLDWGSSLGLLAQYLAESLLLGAATGLGFRFFTQAIDEGWDLG